LVPSRSIGVFDDWGRAITGDEIREPTLRDSLRRATAAAHQRVDDLFGSSDFGNAKGYSRFLRAQACAWETLWPLLDPGSKARADALRRDLDTLRLDRPEPLPEALPDALSIGHRYVLEGSRLGSTVLLRALSEAAPSLASRASAYLTESAKIDGWKRLSTSLQMDRDGCDSPAMIIDDALFMFGLFERAWRATDGASAKVS
jgi:heme oxygenase